MSKHSNNYQNSFDETHEIMGNEKGFISDYDIERLINEEIKNISEGNYFGINSKNLTDEEREDLAIKIVAEGILAKEYRSTSSTYKRFLMYIRRKKLLRDKIKEIQTEKNNFSREKTGRVEDLKAQLDGENRKVDVPEFINTTKFINTDITPGPIDTEKIIQARRDGTSIDSENKK